MSRNATVDDLIRYLDASPSPWHAAAEAARRLGEKGAVPLRERDPWTLAAGSAFYVQRGASLIAVRVPAGFSPKSPAPFHVVAAHTDSPCLRLKPRPPASAQGYRQWGVEVYGGALHNSWLDRDLALAGRVFAPGAAEARLVRLDEALLRIPQLAIHLDRSVNDDGLILNAQKHLVPITGQTGGNSLESLLEAAAGASFPDLSFDLCLYDATPAGYGGVNGEFLYSGRLDNLAMCHAALAAFLEAPGGEALQILVLFDHEEVGSVSGHGAKSNFLASVLERTALSLGVDRDAWLRLLPQSFLVSADMAHALHPNYPEKHDAELFPLPNRGPVLKANANVRYATDAFSATRFLHWARRAGVPVQDFVNRADLSCGTTLGPGLSAELGIPAVDVGTPMLSMHSAREMCGTEDQAMMIAVLREFFRG